MSNKQSHHKLFLPDILGEPLTRHEVNKHLSLHPSLWKEFQSFPPDVQEQIYLFLEGKQGLRLLYDRYFQKILNPMEKRKRLEELISSLLGKEVHILQSLPREGNSLSDGGSLVIMDIIAELKDGSLVTIEMQLIGYLFPGERSSCYLSDMIMRLYNRTKERLGKSFSYRDMKPVYLIVLMESSPEEFLQAKSHYIHRGKIQYDSGIKITSLENIVYISLDTYRKISQNKNITSVQDAWLTFLSSDDPEQILKLVNNYPEFLDLYAEIAEFRRNPEELIYMFSDALRIMDHNTTLYMIDEQKKELEERKRELEALRKESEERKQELAAWRKESEAQKQKLEAWRNESEAQKQELEAWRNESEAQKQELEAWRNESKAQKQKLLEREKESEAQKQEIQLLKAQLANVLKK
ncbi:MAG: PD-(D/E)XK nuclease family transposase [Lachnospiraceae bacterium]|nr:PD-(D/E)XK nuclease family transposase [Lachnospiraceae bacterium]